MASGVSNLDQAMTFASFNPELYGKAKGDCEKAIQEFEGNWQELETFHRDVRHRGSQLNRGLVDPLPSQKELMEQYVDKAKQYESFLSTLDKVKAFGERLQHFIHFMDSMRQSLELSPGGQVTAEDYQRYTLEFCVLRDKVIGLQEKMNGLIHGAGAWGESTTAWSMQRLHDITSQGGAPLGALWTSWNRIGTPYVPTLETAQQELDAFLKAHAVEEPEKKEAVESPKADSKVAPAKSEEGKKK